MRVHKHGHGHFHVPVHHAQPAEAWDNGDGFTLTDGGRWDVPLDMTEVPAYAFCNLSKMQGCKDLKLLVLHARVSKIGEAAFGLCSNLTEVRFEDAASLKEIAVTSSTLGEELGDPCCFWAKGAEGADADYQALIEGWAVTHPGDAAAAPSVQSYSCDAYEDSGTVREGFWLDGEEQYSAEFHIDNWPLHPWETSYVDFVWDLEPEDAARCADGCYIVGLEAIVDGGGA